ncbi:hypothetical protein [Metabacillus sp. RGM 3146]|uniref:hypothetical protein n=1 Tax=Metabacillus sp. RGM 3146 TaxID=3401092 RepID=UPI003B9AFFA9
MKKSEWNEEGIEKLLGELPGITDKRPKSEIRQNVEMRMQQKSRKVWIGPLIASAAVLLILFIVSPSWISQLTGSQSSNEKSSSSSKGPEKIEVSENSAAKKESVNSKKSLPETPVSDSSKTPVSDSSKAPQSDSENRAPAIAENKETAPKQTAVAKTFVVPESQKNRAVVIALRDQNIENIIPVTFEGSVNDSKPSQINQLLDHVNIEAMGFAPPEIKGLEFQDQPLNTVHVNVTDGRKISSEADSFLKDILEETFRWSGYKKIDLMTNGKEGIDFGPYGKLNSLELKKEMKKAYYLFQTETQHQKLLTPSRETYATINQAVEAMKTKENNSQKSLLLKELPIKELKSAGHELIIYFSKHSQMEKSEQYVVMLEGLLLTAKEFGFETVRFKNLQAARIGRMDVTKPVAVPYSPNPIHWKNG